MKKHSPVWHPFTQAKTAPAAEKVLSGRGVYLELEDGRQIIDCISSWWVNLHGHANPVIAKAIYEQALELEHVIFAGFTHEPAEQLARKLLEYLPGCLNHVFFSDNGSTSVEVALKMACQYWFNKGEPRTRYIAFEGGYHGDTFGAMSAGKSSNFFEAFRPLLFDVDLIPYPATFDSDDAVEFKEEEVLSRLISLMDQDSSRYAAIVIEPLVQGVAGMRMCRSEFLCRLEQIAQERRVLVIYDEVMTGFGRTGDWFACNKAGTIPDIVCLSKGISGGFLPLAVTVATSEIFNTFLDDELQKALLHGHSYTANPIACAAALASMTLLEDNCNSFINAELMHRRLAAKHLFDLNSIRNMRFCGTIAAFDLKSSRSNNYFDENGPLLKQRFLDKGLLMRPLGNSIYLMPPYCINGEQLDFVYQRIAEVLRAHAESVTVKTPSSALSMTSGFE